VNDAFPNLSSFPPQRLRRLASLCLLAIASAASITATRAQAEGKPVSPELLEALAADIRASTLTMPAERRVYSWLVADKLIGDEETYETTQARLIQRSVLFANQFWTDKFTAYGGMAGSGTYAALDPLHSMSYGYDAKSPTQWILMSIPVPEGARILDLRRFWLSAQTQQLLREQAGCAPGTYQEMIVRPPCYDALRAGLEKLDISGVVYAWGQSGTSCAKDGVAFVLFNPAIFERAGFRHFRLAHQDRFFVEGALSDEVKDEMAFLDQVARPLGVALWPLIDSKALASRLNAAEPVATTQEKTVLGCSSAWSYAQSHPGSLLDRGGKFPTTGRYFPLGHNRDTQVPLIPMSNIYTGITVIEATFGGNYQGPESGMISKKAEVVAACDGKAMCQYPVDYEALGNPFPGLDKVFRLTYRCSKARVTDEARSNPGKTGRESHPLPLICADDEGVIKVQSADILPQYPIPPTGNATAAAAQFLKDKRKAIYKVSAQFLGDPLPGLPKSFEMTYACPKDPTDIKRISIPADAEGKEIGIECE
jgi:hypothetical protein